MAKNIAILLAGGVGSRLGADRPKQFLPLAGMMVIEHSLWAFERCAAISEIAVVVHPQHIDTAQTLQASGRWTKFRRVLTGGNERYDSSMAAIEAYSDEDTRLIFHDAVRPAVSQRIIAEVCAALDHHQAVNVVLPATDTIIEVDAEGRIVGVPDRSRLMRVQTPQGFHTACIRQAYRRALQDAKFRGTDDCGVVFRYLPKVPIALVRGEERNLKLTYADDQYLLTHYLTSTTLD